MSEKKEKLEKVKLMLRPGRGNRNKSMRLGRHSITRKMQEFELNEAEVKELKRKGPQHHLIGSAEFEALKKDEKDALEKAKKNKK